MPHWGMPDSPGSKRVRRIGGGCSGVALVRMKTDDLHANLPPVRSSLPRMRSLLAEFLDGSHVNDDASYNAQLVMHELVANAIEHGSNEQDEIDVFVELLRNRLCIVVSDNARKSRVPVALTPDEHREHGRGLQVVAQLADWSEKIVRGRREVRAELLL